MSSDLRRDVRFACRTLAKTPGVTLVVVLSLALGIGANTAIFTIINGLLMKSLPVDKPGELVLYSDGRNWGFISGQRGRQTIFSYPLYERLRDQQKSFVAVAAFRTALDRLNVRAEGESGGHPAQLAWGRLVSGNYFSVLGVRPALGRMLAAEDERLAAAPVAVLSFDYWKRRFHLSPSVIGQSLNMNGVFVTVVGIAPAEFFGESLESELADVWLPLTLQPRSMQRKSVLDNAWVSWLNLIARLKPGVTMAQAQADVNVTFQQFQSDIAAANLSSPERREQLRRNYIVLTSGAGGVSRLRFRYSQPLHILLAVAGFVLLIACANVANLLLSRAVAREKEISLRLALGAGRLRLLRQLLTESLLLAVIGGALGVLLARWLVAVLVAGVSTGDRTVPLNVSPDLRLLAFTLGACLLTGVLFGLLPALRPARTDVWAGLKGAAPFSRARSGWRAGQAFVVIQVALSLPLLAGAALFVQTLRQLVTQDLGFSHERVLEVGIDPSIAGYTPDRLEPLYRKLLDRAGTVPGVRAASLSLYSPMSGDNWSGAISVEGYTLPPKQTASCQWVWVGERYVEVQGMKLLLGRDLTPRDSESAPKVAVVNETFVRRYLAGQNPVGRRLSMSVPTRTYEIEIVGVVKDFKFNDPRQDFWPVAFLPLVQASMTPARFARYLEVRASGDPLSVAAGIRTAVKQVDPNLPVTSIRTLSRQVEAALGREKLIAGVSGFFAALALALTSIGLYGVLAYAVTRRAKEIGVRMALGAGRAKIVGMVLRQALLLALAGAAIGLLASIVLARTVASQLYGLKPTDPLTLAGAAFVLTLAAALAGFVPARRAARVDPMATLRAE